MRVRIKDAASFIRNTEKILKFKFADRMKLKPEEIGFLQLSLQQLSIKAFGVSHQDIEVELNNMKTTVPLNILLKCHRSRKCYFFQTSIVPFASPILVAVKQRYSVRLVSLFNLRNGGRTFVETKRTSVNYSYTESFACIQIR